MEVTSLNINDHQTTIKKTPQQLERANLIVASFRDVLRNTCKPKQEAKQTPAQSNQNTINLFRKYPDSNYSERHSGVSHA